MENTTQYYNAKPSKIANIGLDIAGAKRHNFNTYETTEEREIRERKKVADKRLATVRLNLKNAVLSETPCIEAIASLLESVFKLSYGFDILTTDIKSAVIAVGQEAKTREERSNYYKMVNAYNSLHRNTYRLRHYPARVIAKMRAKYQPKGSFTEQSGAFYEWKNYNVAGENKNTADFLALNSKAVQFGNSVTDSERGGICKALSEFIQQWQANELFNKIDISPVAWSFGARGKAGSVAYYQPSGKIISVNRNNIGSIIHELGHYIDFTQGRLSSEISFRTVEAYRKSIESGLDAKSLRYYCKREEIFARAFEAYCFQKLAGFSEFAQCGKMFLPELNDELISLVERALKIN